MTQETDLPMTTTGPSSSLEGTKSEEVSSTLEERPLVKTDSETALAARDATPMEGVVGSQQTLSIEEQK